MCRRVYNAYRHAFNVLRSMPEVQTAQDNAQLTLVLQRLVDEHGLSYFPMSHPMSYHMLDSCLVALFPVLWASFS